MLKFNCLYIVSNHIYLLHIEKMKKSLIIIWLMSLLLLTGCQKTTQSDVNAGELAKCLWEKWVKMYGTATCSHCITQKKIFGDDFKYINYVDCGVTPEQCQELNWTPTREFSNGDRLEWLQELKILKEKSGC